MIAGLSGELISHAYVEQQLLPGVDRARVSDFERRLRRWWQRTARAVGPASSARAIMDIAIAPLLELLEHDRPAASPEAYGLGSRLDASDAVLLVLPWSAATQSAWREAIRRGIDAHATWAVIANGHALSIIDCSRPWSRCVIEFDFDHIAASSKGIAALWLLAHAAAMAGRQAPALRAHVVGSDAHGAQVCQSLSDGVLAALPKLAEALGAGRASGRFRDAAFDQALTMVYRILFLLFAEARALVPIWNEVYREAYTIDALTERATRTTAPGLWQALQAISRLAHTGCKAGDLDVTAFNGRLFSPRHAPLIDQRHVSDDVIREVLLLLATEATGGGRRRISYHDLGVEQLGSVYERVLEYEPAAPTATIALTRTSIRRKATGSFYTPQALTESLVRKTLAPLAAGRPLDEILKLRILDPAMGSGAFLVAACRYLAECCEHAIKDEGRWAGAGDSAIVRATLRRQVAERCLYGVDLNPTAVQLARLSLWLTTLAGDRPLTFLDHHLAAGNSLIGAWLADLSHPPHAARNGPQRSSLPLLDDLIAEEVAGRVLPARLRLSLEPSDSVDAVKRKERSLAELTRAGGPIARWTAAADAWCAGALWPGPPPAPGVVGEWIAAATGAATSLPSRQLSASLGRARSVAAAHAVFHWELAFPEVFFDAEGRPSQAAGFDAVIGNPPWDMMRADSGSSVERLDAKSATRAALRFCRLSRAYRQQGAGHPNRYQLFLERALRLTRPGGRLGLLLPSGLATDHGSAPLRRHLLDRTTIDTWIGFDNRQRIFPIHRSMRFLMIATTNAGSTETLRFRCGLTGTGALHHDAELDVQQVSRARLEAWSPEHLTIPEVPNATALAIMTTIADRVPALASPSGWGVRFGRELNATDDRPHFVRLAGRQRARLLPIVEGKQLSPFQVAVDRSAFGIAGERAAKILRATNFNRARIAYRDVASATNKLTLIAARLPAGVVSTHTVFA